MAINKITDLGKTASTQDENGNTVIRKIYEVEETITTKREINTALLKTKKVQLQKEIDEIDSMLTQMED